MEDATRTRLVAIFHIDNVQPAIFDTSKGNLRSALREEQFKRISLQCYQKSMHCNNFLGFNKRRVEKLCKF